MTTRATRSTTSTRRRTAPTSTGRWRTSSTAGTLRAPRSATSSSSATATSPRAWTPIGARRWLFEVVFDYGEGHYADDGEPADDQHSTARAALASAGQWTARPDPFSAYRAGFEVRTYRRCAGC